MIKATRRALVRGDRRRNAKLAALRAVVRRYLVFVSIDLAAAKQAVAVMDHDSIVLARKMFICGPWGLGGALEWAGAIAVEGGHAGIVVACEPS